VSDVRWWHRLAMRARHTSLYPLPKPLPRTRRYWQAFGLVTIAVIAFSTYFCVYLMAMHDAFQTNAEDFGIMDQALWSILHGFFLDKLFAILSSIAIVYLMTV